MFDLFESVSLDAVREEAKGCTRCPLFASATQTVFGHGPQNAAVVMVGEQPGDQEDIVGRPFVGPAGKVLDRALLEAGVNRETLYVTNAVKHFKFVPRGKIRLHQKPEAPEINACYHWIEREINLIQPKLVVALGATAARSGAGKTVTIGKVRGQKFELYGRPGLVTVHPSYLLRLPDPQLAELEYGKFVADLRTMAKWAPEVRLAA
jgi:DNA polymerase